MPWVERLDIIKGVVESNDQMELEEETKKVEHTEMEDDAHDDFKRELIL